MAVSTIENSTQFDLLWESQGWGSFNAQTISLSLSNYDAVKVEFYSQNNDDPTTAPIEVPVGGVNSAILWHGLAVAGVNTNVGTRLVSANTTGVYFGDYAYKNYTSGGGKTTSNTNLVPRKIYGIKY